MQKLELTFAKSKGETANNQRMEPQLDFEVVSGVQCVLCGMETLPVLYLYLSYFDVEALLLLLLPFSGLGQLYRVHKAMVSKQKQCQPSELVI